MDADLSHDPADAAGAAWPSSSTAPTWPSAAATCPAGAPRTGRGSAGALSRWGNRYAAGVLGLAVNDATAGYRAYSADRAGGGSTSRPVAAEGYGFQIEMTYRLVRAAARWSRSRSRSATASAGESKMSGNIVSEAFVLVLKLWAQDCAVAGERRRAEAAGRRGDAARRG